MNDAATLAELINSRLSRRAMLAGLAGGAAAVATSPTVRDARGADEQPGDTPSTLTFREVAHGVNDRHYVAEGYASQIVMRWGDAVENNAPEFDIQNQSPDAQAKQFGYNNDFIAFMPLPRGSNSSDHGLLCVNHEYTVAQLMFPGFKDKLDSSDRMTEQQAAIERVAHGHSIVEIKRGQSGWQRVAESEFNRRITGNTEMYISGPAAGDVRLRTGADPSGTRVIGTLNDCAGGVTPWGTVLMGEENFDGYFAGLLAKHPDRQVIEREVVGLARFGLANKPKAEYSWSRFYNRFRIDIEPRESNRFGWIVEYDPYDPKSVPVKRTALGRFKHEGATCTLTPDGRVVVYSGDDSRGEFLYRFVSEQRYDPSDREKNRHLLDQGTLYVARFQRDGTLEWLPLVHGNGPLDAKNGFTSQADVLIDARLAGSLLRATPMDRPEDVEVNPVTGRVYVMLTNFPERPTPNPANPRAANKHGHIIELSPPRRGGRVDHAADEFRWDIFLLAGNPADQRDRAAYHPGVSRDGWLSCPDNGAFDSQGRLWIATDGWPESTVADGVFACDTTGPGRALTRQFFRAPTGAEVCGPCFTPDGKTFFVSVQHPGDDVGSTFDNPSTRWPDFEKQMPPRPAVVAIWREDGGKIGG
jgi:secreted PhoX family phosphatase